MAETFGVLVARVLVCTSVFWLGACAHREVPRMSMLQPGEQPQEAPPSEPPLAPVKRAVVGLVVQPGTSERITADKYVHIQDDTNYSTDAASKPQGFRAVCGPYLGATQLNLKIINAPRTYNTASFDFAPEINAGYATLWGWRPYIRLQRISIAAEGSWIVVQKLTDVTDRIMLVHTESGKRVAIWDNSKPNSDPTIHDFTGDSVFVDVTYTGGSPPFTFTTPAQIASNADASALLTHATGKMR